MNLTVRDVSALLNVSQKTIYRWLKQGAIPAYRIQDQYRFHRAEILEWATARRIPLSPKLFDEPAAFAEPSRPVRLLPALEAGGIHYRVEGKDRKAVLESVVRLLPLDREVDRSLLAQMLEARENLGSTAVGKGVAIPHPRYPIIVPPSPDTLSICFLEHGVDFGALDGEPVRVLCVLISSTVKSHLRLLARLAFALQHPEVSRCIAEEAGREALLEAFGAVDRELDRRDRR